MTQRTTRWTATRGKREKERANQEHYARFEFHIRPIQKSTSTYSNLDFLHFFDSRKEGKRDSREERKRGLSRKETENESNAIFISLFERVQLSNNPNGTHVSPKHKVSPFLKSKGNEKKRTRRKGGEGGRKKISHLLKNNLRKVLVLILHNFGILDEALKIRKISLSICNVADLILPFFGFHVANARPRVISPGFSAPRKNDPTNSRAS
jgi:hypothetical protein